eukprot:m.1122055 g.1122055  ORF g.1122055 m.1122055 type:complete len:297 (-) comp24401_c1_seq5:577-1467(-)
MHILSLLVIASFIGNPSALPSPSSKHRSDRPCASPEDCAMNGECTEGRCICRPPWIGEFCEVLQRLPIPAASGYQSPHNPTLPQLRQNISSWGGSILQDDDGVFHMYAAEMLYDCGIDSWSTNSQVVHAVSSTPGGPYTFRDVVLGAFATEPNAVRGPSGEYVVFATVREPEGSTPANCTDQPSRAGSPSKKQSIQAQHTYMVWAMSPDGPWSKPVLVLSPPLSRWDNRTISIDTNLAVVIHPDGSLTGIWRKCENTPETVCAAECCTFPHLLRATNWKDPSTYAADVIHQLFPQV